MRLVVNSATLLVVLLLPTLGASYCALMLDPCSVQGKMAELAVGAPDCCLSCFEAACKEGIIKSSGNLRAPRHQGTQAWLPTTVLNLAVASNASTFASEIALNTGPPAGSLLSSVLRI